MRRKLIMSNGALYAGYQLWRMLNHKRRLELVLILFLILLVSMAEVISLGAVLPFLGVLAAPDQVFKSKLLMGFSPGLNLLSEYDLMLYTTLFFGLTILVVNLLRFFLLHINLNFSAKVGSDFSYRIYFIELNQPYIDHINSSSSKIISGVTNKVNSVIGVISMLLNLMASTLIIAFIISAMLLVNPQITSMLFFGFLTIYIVLMFLTKSSLQKNSIEISENTSAIIKSLQEGLGAIRDVLIDGTQKFYCKRYKEADIRLRLAQCKNQLISQSPRYGVETMGMLLIVAIAFILRTKSEFFFETLPLLGLIALGSQRILPLLQQGYASWAGIRGESASIEEVVQLLNRPLIRPSKADDEGVSSLGFNNSIIFKGVSFKYPGSKRETLSNLNFEIKKGSILGVMGPTGGGKSTLLDLLMGLLHPTQGQITVDGVQICAANVNQWYRHISHVPQTIYLADGTIAENIAFGVSGLNFSIEKVEEAAARSQLMEYILLQPAKFETSVGERGIKLSGGQRQRIGVARALYKNTGLLILDEATSALDTKTEEKVIASIEQKANDFTLVIVAHRLSTLKHCDKILLIEGGSISRIGSYQELIENI